MIKDKEQKIVSLCKRRGFVFQSSEIYGGLKSAYDYGPLGVELKRQIANAWWNDTVTKRQNVVGLDASIMMRPEVWQTSGHLDGFNDPLVDCLKCKSRFRADKAPKSEGAERGYVCPECQSSELSPERQFNLMFRTSYGPVDPVDQWLDQITDKALSKKELRSSLAEAVSSSSVYLRPETAQAMFVQFLNVQQSTSQKVPFGIAQIGKSFRNEIITEHFVFRSCEFEQMEMEFFCEPGTKGDWLEYWKKERMSWYKKFANSPDDFRLRAHEPDELAHYSDACFDVEYLYPWGWDELEGIASRTDYDLKKHAAATGTKLSYFDQQKEDPETGKNGWRYIPYVIEPAAGLTRAFFCFLLDAYHEEKGVDAKGNEKTRIILKLHPSLAPYQVAVLPLLRKDGHPERAEAIASILRSEGFRVSRDDASSIGKRYAKHDEVGTPFCVTVDGESIEGKGVTVRHRDTAEQVRVSEDNLANWLRDQKL